MLIADVTVLLGAFAVADTAYPELSGWVARHLSGHEAFGVSELVLSAVIRISTNRRAYPTPATPEEALDFCQSVRAAPAAHIVAPGARHWEIFVRTTHATANLVPDAYLAALAIENGATFVSRDAGLRRFPGLRLLDPLAG
jgi:toxin-antitoxin system PIN domain toxin